MTALLIIAAVLAAMIAIPFVARSPSARRPVFSAQPDLPVGFAFKVAWIAVRGIAPERLAAALRLADVEPCNWGSGLGHAYVPGPRSFATKEAAVAAEFRFGATPYVFVSPPTDGWTFAVGQRLAYMDSFAFKALGSGHAPDKLLPFLERLSAELDTTVHYFFTHDVPDMHVWVRSDRGTVVRAYGVFGESGEVVFDHGPPTEEERALGWTLPTKAGGLREEGRTWIDEESVLAVAGAWTTDPRALAELGEPGVGCIGIFD